MFTFIHTADLHLDSPLQKLEQYEGAPVEALRGATRRALENLVTLALERSVDFVLIAGDLFDRDWKDYNTGLFFAAQMAKLREADIPVFLIGGNHDAASRITKSLKFPENVRQFPVDRPDTMILEDLGAAVHGQGYATQSITHDLSPAYPAALPGYFNIGLLHTAATGREGHDTYAPCTVEGLVGKGYDYWALGHIHTREILHERPFIVFPGNIQGRHIRECDSKGCMVVSVDDHGDAALEFQPLDVIRWTRLEIDMAAVADGFDAAEKVCEALEAALETRDGLPLAARVALTGPCKAHDILAGDPERWISQIRAAATDAGAGRIWVEKVLLSTEPPPRKTRDAVPDGPVGEILSFFDAVQEDPDLRSALGNVLEDLHRKLPQELRQNSEVLRLEDDEWLADTLTRVRPLLLHRLLDRGDRR
ncbi:MAG: metallophosphoesterase family protein [Thermodesulfobacteriota bacterium]